MLELIFRRRSIRSYLNKPIEKEILTKILKAATAAPTAANCQPWEFIVVTEQQKLEELRKKMVFAKYNAPAAIVVCGNMDLAFKGPGKEMWVQDCSAAMENILLASTALGLGSVWIGVYPIESNVECIRSVFRMPKHVIPLGIAYIGYAAEEKEPRYRLDEKRVYWEEYEEERKHRTKDKPKKGHY